MDNLFQDLENLTASAKEDFIKFSKKGNAAAGTRLRKKLQAMVVLSKEIRKAVSVAKKERSSKKGEVQPQEPQL